MFLTNTSGMDILLFFVIVAWIAFTAFGIFMCFYPKKEDKTLTQIKDEDNKTVFDIYNIDDKFKVVKCKRKKFPL